MQVTFADTLATQRDYLISVYFTKEVNPSLTEPPEAPFTNMV